MGRSDFQALMIRHPLNMPMYPDSKKNKHIFIMAGEASGEAYGARLVKAARAMDPDLRFSGVGGQAMAAAGVDLLYPASSLTVMGLTGVLLNLVHIWKVLKNLEAHLQATRPDLVVLIDFAGFNFRLAAIAKKLDLKVLYYVSPKIWAWRTGRARKLSRLADHLAVLFPFEKDFYARTAPELPVTFVGHPILDEEADDNLPDLPARVCPPGKTLIGLLPGSRRTEISRLMPVLMGAARIIKSEYPEAVFALPLAPGLTRDEITPHLDPSLPLTLLDGQARQVMTGSRILLIASGTATLQATLAAVPMIVIYKFSRINAALARRLIKVKYASMTNLILGYELLPELLQEEATPDKLAAAALSLLRDERRRQAMITGMKQARRLLGGPGASRRAAQLALNMITGYN
ncbi:MAG: lipid-A-disaccharide synthase [Desulfarculales bacterium]|nr:lipid-A-disaccharide synthase [Desulfarculales bacterium]